jgi:erythronate-4-phosphate dehydrogenase
MKIVADQNISYVREAFSTFGDVAALNAREIDRKLVRDADILLVRSVTRVNRGLLEDSSVRFVATATIGVDHIDQAYLEENDIQFVSAPGSNAKAVAEYVTAALLTLTRNSGRRLAGSSIAIAGVGNVGSISSRYAAALGMTVLHNDPPLARSTADAKYRPLDEVLGSDFVTCHVPLTRNGEDPTYHLVNGEFLSKMIDGATLINSSRGPVVNGSALHQELDSGRISAVLDVWEEEPNIDVSLLDKLALGTPHIAGYSLDAKLRATIVIRQAASSFFKMGIDWDHTKCLPPPALPELRIDGSGKDDEDVVREAVLSAYDITADDASLRDLKDVPAEERSVHFADLRTEYPLRREFHNTDIELINCPASAGDILRTIGFGVRQ